MQRTLVDLPEAIAVARDLVERIVWCTVATSGAAGPRTRLMHPVWWWDDPAPVALVTCRPTPLKRRHLAASPAVSCFYWDPAHDTVAIDAVAEWVPSEERAAAWAAIAAVPPPVGFDPAMIWPDGPDVADCAILRLTAHRLVAAPAGRSGVRWEAEREGALSPR
jgi:hypothetical protein